MALHCIEIPRMAAFFKCSRLFSFIAYLLLCPTFELPHCFSLSLRENSPFLPATRNFFKLHFNCNLEINWQKRLSKLTNSEKNICFQTYANVNVDSFFPGRQIHIYWLLDGIGQLEITTLPTRLALPRGKMTKSQCCWWLPPPAQVPLLWSWRPYLLSKKRTRFTLGS